MKKLLDLINILKILESQHEMAKEIVDSETSEQITEIKRKFESLGSYAIEVKSRDELNFYMMEYVTKFIFGSVFDELTILISLMKKKLSQKNLLNYLNDVKIIVKHKQNPFIF